MKERNIYRMLTVTLAVAVLVLVVVLIRLYRNVYYIPETAIADLCATLAEDGITLTPSQVSRKREGGVIYMGSDNDEDTAYRLTESEIRNAFAVPDGMLYLHYNGDLTTFGTDFQIHYRRADAEDRLDEHFSDAVPKSRARFSKRETADCPGEALRHRSRPWSQISDVTRPVRCMCGACAESMAWRLRKIT